jgi:hypothetical protein
VAIGPNVTANTIIGMSMICAGKFRIGIKDEIINSRVLHTTLFPVTYKPTVCSPLNNLTASNDDSKIFAMILEDTHVSSSTIQTCITEAFTAIPKAETKIESTIEAVGLPEF